MRFAMTTAILLVGSLLFSAPIPKKEAKDYYAMKVGAKWTYELMDDKDKAQLVTEVIADSIQKDKSRKVDLSQTLSVDKTVLSKKTETYRIAGDVLELIEVNGKKSDEIRLPLNIAPGGTWTMDPNSEKGQKVTLTAGELEEIIVPAGKYKAIRVTATVKDGDSKRIVNITWFAEGVGVIKMESDGSVRLLTAFTPGKDK